MTKPRASSAVECHICNKTIGRRADLARHMRTHATNKEELMHACPYLGCTYKTLQRSNLATHLNVHSRERPYKCPADGCDFSSSDPGSLTRHRKDIHGYEPKTNSENHPSTITRKAARQQRRISPYTTSSSTPPSSSGRSESPLDPSSIMYHTPSPQVPPVLDLFPPSSLSLAENHAKGIKNTSAAYSTELITKLSQVNDSTLPSNPEPENSLPLTPGLLTAPEAPMAEYPQPPVPEQGDFYEVDVPAQPVSETTFNKVGDAAFADFLAQFDEWNTEAAPLHTAAPLFTPVIQHTTIVAPVPIPASLPMPLIQYNVPAPTPISLPSYEFTADNTSYSYSTESMSFGTPFSQPYSFAAPDMGLYPQVVDQSYFYPASAATSILPMQGLYLY